MPLTRPTTTPMPDEIFDYWAPRLGEAELKVLLYIVRRTLGFKKEADAISLKQFIGGIVTHDGRVLDAGCGVKGRANVVRALKSLAEMGLIRSHKAQTVEGDSAVTVYSLWWREDNQPAPADDRQAPTEPPAGGGSVTKPPWFRCEQEVVSERNHRSSAAEPTTNSKTTNRTQQTGTVRDGAPTRPMPAKPPPPATRSTAPAHSVQRSGRAATAETTADRNPPSPRAGADDAPRADPTSDAASDAAYRALVQPVRAVGRALGDATPRASLTRAYHLLRASGLDRDAFMTLLAEAAAITQEHGAQRPGPAGRDQPRRLMPYFFGVLERLVQDHTARPHAETTLAAAPPVEEIHPIWRAVLADLRGVLTAENYAAWLATTHVVRQEGTCLTVGVHTSFQRAWLTRKLQGRIEGALARCGHQEILVSYVLVPAETGVTAATMVANAPAMGTLWREGVTGGGRGCSPA